MAKSGTNKRKYAQNERQFKVGWAFGREIIIPEPSPRVLDRLIPMNCQVVIESCKGTYFCTDVVRLQTKKKRKMLKLWVIKGKLLVHLCPYFC